MFDVEAKGAASLQPDGKSFLAALLLAAAVGEDAAPGLAARGFKRDELLCLKGTTFIDWSVAAGACRSAQRSGMHSSSNPALSHTPPPLPSPRRFVMYKFSAVKFTVPEVTGFPLLTEAHSSALACALRAQPALYADLKERRTASAFSLDRAMQPGLDFPACRVGCVAGDVEAYFVFAELYKVRVWGCWSLYSPWRGALHQTSHLTLLPFPPSPSPPGRDPQRRRPRPPLNGGPVRVAGRPRRAPRP